MSRKPPPKPLLAVQHDFVDSLDALVARLVTFRQAVETALSLGMIDKRVAPQIAEELARLDKALLSED